MAKKIKLDSLEQIKRLIILQLMLTGVSSDAVGAALGVDGSAIRHMMPLHRVKRKK